VTVPFDQFVTFLATADLEEATAFYRDTLGLELALDQGRCRIFRVSGDGFLGVCEGVPSPDGVIVTLVATDVEARCRRLEEAGVAFERPLRHHPELDITHAFLRDPDGHLVEIQRFDDPRWAV
jgi:catechol 2,3-dioxygenase-like lactoylglutathione lyase family enzyme